jgi:hypothetical protein
MRDKPKIFDVNSSKAGQIKVYPMLVKTILNKWPESDERKRLIVTYEKAEKLVQKDLRKAMSEMMDL